MEKIKKFFNNKKNTIIVISLLLIAIIFIGLVRSIGYNIFVSNYSSGNHAQAIKVMNWGVNSQNTNNKIIKYLTNEVEVTYNKYLDEQISYQEAKKIMEILSDYIDVDMYSAKVNNLNNSRQAFKKAESLKNADNINSVIEYSKVIKDDKNYSTAQTQIKSLKSQIINEALPELEAYKQNGDFESGYKLSAVVVKAIDNDKINEYYNQFKKQYEDNEKLKNCDLTTSEGIKTYLTIKYGLLKNTAIGDIELEFEVSEQNTANILCYDYRIRVDEVFASYKLSNLRDGNNYNMQTRRTADAQLKKHMETLAKDIIAKLPNKKFEGNYGEMFEDRFGNFHTIYSCYSWTNYEETYPSNYYNTKPGSFRWSAIYHNDSFIDD